MNALTVWQPWASLIVDGFKVVENRTWPAPRKLPMGLWIHAARTWDSGAEIGIREAGIVLPDGYLNPSRHTSGCIIGAVELYQCDRKASIDPFAVAGMYHWWLRSAKRIDPVPCVGSQGIWMPPASVDDMAMALFLGRTPPNPEDVQKAVQSRVLDPFRWKKTTDQSDQTTPPKQGSLF